MINTLVNRVINSPFIRRFVTSPRATGGSLVLLILFTLAIFSPFIAPQNPYNLEQLSLGNSLLPPAWADGGDPEFLLGTDDQGRGILSVTMYGLRTSLTVGFGITAVAGLVGIFFGLIAGYYEGFLGGTIMRFSDVVFSFDPMLVAILLLGVLGKRGVFMVILAIAPVEAVRYIRTTRSKVLSLKNKEFVEAARATGASTPRIILRHLLPNSLGPLVVLATVDLAILIMLEATLSFLGIGVAITEPSLGLLISSGKDYLFAGYWWLTVFPGGALISLVLSINLLGDWLRDELNPKVVAGH